MPSALAVFTLMAGPMRSGLDVSVGSNSEVGARNRHVRFPPDSDQTADIAGGPFRANSRSGAAYSIASSARASKPAESERPIDLAAFEFITSSYFVGACTGKSAGFAPLSIRSTYSAERA
jgi:hypothetical protein